MKTSDYIAKTLARKRVPAVFELSGGMITHLLDSLHLNGSPRIVSMHHEQSAAFAADAAGRITGIPGVAMATSGPGATNLLTGIGSCFFDSTPAVFITGQVNRSEQKGRRAVRQLGFQETDIVSMAEPITKRAWRVTEAAQVPDILDSAFAIAMEGRPGPVLIDIPMDVQRADIQAGERAELRSQPASYASRNKYEAVRNALAKSTRPMILAGGGIRSADAIDEFRAFAATAGVPVVHSLMAVDVLPFADPLNIGMIGSYGNRWANLSLSQSDCLMVLGSRLDVRQTGSQTEEFKGSRPIFHIDCEPGEMNNRVTGCHAITSHLKPALLALTSLLSPIREQIAANTGAWRREISRLRRLWPDTSEFRDLAGINPNILMHALSKAGQRAAAWVVDVGQHQMWAAQSLEIGVTQRFLTSGGMGSMGFGLPAAIGAAICLPGQTVVAIAGDGGFQCNIQELQTIVRLGLPVKIVIINNQCHGMVRQFQESYFEGRYQSTMWGYSAPDFERVANAYGISARTAAQPGEVCDAVKWLWAETLKPALLQVMISPLANAYPKVSFGRRLDSME